MDTRFVERKVLVLAHYDVAFQGEGRCEIISHEAVEAHVILRQQARQPRVDESLHIEN